MLSRNFEDRLIGVVLTGLLLSHVAGCSLLGFAPVPVAHLMTEDTKCILEKTSKFPDVPRELSKVALGTYFLQPGDQILLETIDGSVDVRLPPDQEVQSDGTIDLGEFGRVVVTGLSLEQAEDSIQQTIATQSDESVAVNFRLIQPVHRYYVIGEVNSPGAYPLTGYETVLDAIMEAGGLTSKASACDLLLARPTAPQSCRVTLPVCYRAITQLGDTTTNYHLRPGDRIFVARQSCKEEMLAYVAGAKTCERCCKKQVACCDPKLADSTPADFPFGRGEIIMPPEPPETQLPDHDESNLEDVTVGNPDSSQLFPPSEQGFERSRSSRRAQPSMMDGELDFEMVP